MHPKLILTLNDDVIEEVILDKEVTSIGRKASNDVRIDNLAVSGTHAKILAFGNDCFLEDLDSTNGTYVNGDRISKHVLQPGDKIAIGKHQLLYENEAAAAAGGEEEDFEKTMILKPYAPGMGGEAVMGKTAPPPPSAPAPQVSAPVASESPALNASLQLLSGANVGKRLMLTKTLTRLGKPGAQIAAIQMRPQGCYIFNVPGTSGGIVPSLNGSELGVKAIKLNHGDVIEVGSVRMKYVQG